MDNKPFEIEVTYVVRINNLEDFVKDVKAAVLQIQPLPADIAMRNAASKIFENALNNAVVKVNDTPVKPAEAATDSEDLGVDKDGNQIY